MSAGVRLETKQTAGHARAEAKRLRAALEKIANLVRRDLKPLPELSHIDWQVQGEGLVIGAQAIQMARDALKGRSV